MNDALKLRLGTRNSPLAMAQAHETRDRLCAAHGWEPQAIEIVEVLASGDKVLDRPLAEIGGKALWTKELDAWLAEGRIDLAVHSAKDVETIRPDAFHFAAFLPRADRRDALVGAASIADIPHGAVVGTSAPRRAAQLLNLRPDCKVVTFRGNVATRLRKLDAREADVTFLAAAGLERLGQSEVGAPLSEGDWIPAAAQGVIAIECRAGDVATTALLAAIDHPATRAELMQRLDEVVQLGTDLFWGVNGLGDFVADVFAEAFAQAVDGYANDVLGDTQSGGGIGLRECFGFTIEPGLEDLKLTFAACFSLFCG